MKQVIDNLIYDADDTISTGILYLSGSDDFLLQGPVKFEVYGQATMSVVDLPAGIHEFEFIEPILLKVGGKGSAIIFRSLPEVIPSLDPCTAVPDVPDMMDAHNAQMYQLFEQWAVKRGIDIPPDTTDGEDDSDDDSGYGIPIDNDTLLDDEEALASPEPILELLPDRPDDTIEDVEEQPSAEEETTA